MILVAKLIAIISFTSLITIHNLKYYDYNENLTRHL